MPKAPAVCPVGAGTVSVPDPASVAANRASFYAEPAAWLVDAAVGEALRTTATNLDPATVGVVVISDAPTSATMRQIAAGAARGRVSPLRFAGGNPSILAGLTCIQRGFRGPAGVFVGDVGDGVGLALTTAADWLHRGHATHCALVVHREDATGHRADCVLVAPGEDPGGADVAALLTAPAREEAMSGE
jgi:hypothetical protein